MVDFVLKIRSELVWDLKKFRIFFYVRRLRPLTPATFGLVLPSQLVNGYRVSLVSFSESGSQNSLSLQFTTNVEYKIKYSFCICFRTLRIFWDEILRILSDHISKTKNRKIDFSFLPEHCATF